MNQKYLFIDLKVYLGGKINKMKLFKKKSRINVNQNEKERNNNESQEEVFHSLDPVELNKMFEEMLVNF